jgi:hypothetical protein
MSRQTQSDTSPLAAMNRIAANSIGGIVPTPILLATQRVRRQMI